MCVGQARGRLKGSLVLPGICHLSDVTRFIWAAHFKGPLSQAPLPPITPFSLRGLDFAMGGIMGQLSKKHFAVQ